MEWKDTVAYKCRWSEYVMDVLGEDINIVWEDSYSDYQGHANIVAIDHKTNIVIHYEWSYGSCSGCDAWETQPEDTVKAEINKTASRLSNAEATFKYFNSWGQLGQEILQSLADVGYTSIDPVTGKKRFTEL